MTVRRHRREVWIDIATCSGCFAAGFGTAGIAVGIAGLILATAWCHVRRRRRSAEERARVAAAWRTAFDRIAAAFASGADGIRALEVGARASPLPGVSKAARYAQLGGDPVDILATAGDPYEARLAVSLGAATALGIAPRRILTDLANGVAVHEQVGREVALALSVARATARLLAALPCAGVALAALLDPRTVGFLFNRPFGHGCLLAASILEAIGLWWVQKIADGAG